MNDGFDGKKSGGGKAGKGSALWDSLRSLGAGIAEGFLSSSSGPSPGARRSDPVATRDRPAAARQIQRSLKAWRDSKSEPEDPMASSAQTEEAPDASEGEPELKRKLHRSLKTPISTPLTGGPSKAHRSASGSGGSTGVMLTVVGGSQIIVDANIAISLDRKAKGLSLNDAQKRNAEMAEKQGIVLTPKVVQELNAWSGGGGSSGTPIQTRPGRALSEATKNLLKAELANIGINGEGDRQVVMEALTAATTGGVATFASADKNVINALAKKGGIDPKTFGKYKNCAEVLKHKMGTDRFPVTISAADDAGKVVNYQLQVKPVQEVRAVVP